MNAFALPSFPGKGLVSVALILIAFGFSTCKKPEDIGLSTLPDQDLLYTDFSDTASIVTTTIKEDTLRADELSRILFGSYRDSVFGLSTASYYTQVLLSSTPNLIADSSLSRGADSLVLALAYTGWYGDTSVDQTIHVYRLTEDMYYDSAYYSNKTFLEDATDLEGTQMPYTIRPTTPAIVGSDTNSAPQLRIRLNDAIRDSIFGRNSQTEFVNNDNWKSFFKGLHVSLEPVTGNGGLLLYFNPGSVYTRMTLYYHEGTESKSYTFSLTNGARVTHTEQDYTGSLAALQLSDSITQFSENYLQPLAGLKTKISFPYLKHFTDSGSILVNRAELVITVPEGSTTATTPVPESMLLLAKNESGTFDFPIDYYERNFGGTYNATDRTYTFALTRTVQRILNGSATDYGYSLNIIGSMISGSHAIVGSASSADSPMKLKIYYTKLH